MGANDVCNATAAVRSTGFSGPLAARVIGRLGSGAGVLPGYAFAIGDRLRMAGRFSAG